ncbi:MAG: ABC transporter permease [Methanocalculus sp.]|uniref:ABC transporter permease n=1 Tax=Methanocalculus sp. TaxID=2004547 RepID=UPI0027228765|nr:ABC transporter permease [Methanocalculus sp.]MDO9539982.1 ABC transporter permease [Methanocalculus sp.]
MMGDFIFDLAMRNIRINFLRSLLAAIGIVIGVIAITAVGIMGANMTLSVTETLSANSDTIKVSPYSGGGGGMMMGPPQGGSSSSDDEYITSTQLRTIRQIATPNTVIPVYSESDTIYIGGDEGRASIYGLAKSDISSFLSVTSGVIDLQSTNGALVGATLAERYGLKIGSRIKIGDEDGDSETKTVKVSGILEERGMTFDINTDNAIIVTDRWFTTVYGGEGEYDEVIIKVKDINDIEALKTAIDDQLNRKDDEVTISDASRMLDSITSSLQTIISMMQGIGAISLLVASVSIFNVMMMSVTERIREIGILRSIGTRRKVVLKMFLYEASIIGVVGAIIGGVMSFILGYIVVLSMVGTTAYFFTIDSLIYVPYGMFIGVIICVISGLYPAWRASTIDPIKALTAE